MIRSRSLLMVLTVFACALMVGTAQARIWHVPDDVLSVTEAIAAARTGDEIAIAPGVWKIQGDTHHLPTGVVIRADIGMPGAVFLEEEVMGFGQWRDHAVFILDAASQPGSSDQVRFENVTFRNFTQAVGPNQTVDDPLFLVRSGKLILDGCTFDTFIGTALVFEAGVGELTSCQFLHGHGKPVVADFRGEALLLDGCTFQGNTQRMPGDWLSPVDPRRGALLQVREGHVECLCSDMTDNGALGYLVDVWEEAEFTACYACLQPNRCIWQGRVAGTVQLDCCTVTPTAWEVLEGGLLIIVNDNSPQVLSVESTSWTEVKSLFAE